MLRDFFQTETVRLKRISELFQSIACLQTLGDQVYTIQLLYIVFYDIAGFGGGSVEVGGGGGLGLGHV